MAEADALTMELAGLTERQQRGLIDVLDEIRHADGWSWQLPVLLRNRCWLRLSRIPLNELHHLFPPDGRDEAPELMQYRRLLHQGVDPLLAQQSCWQDFGMEDCQRALQAYWRSRDTAIHGWTAQRYRQLVSSYRERIERKITTVPMLVLARKNSLENHRLLWITENTPVMRHTCA
ncbi:hypothetical protein KR52_11845 [Synechococcus sp. KORDI-52]|uniref:hypothetical protein n=1 Tax=Synechococcus sp. KORDI-52 TaxID=585425 RepID=UPI0004E0769B|nr:hypothetical protein [Synechococcus sp. KORDI-52]AII49823.1 hypothetical protein KR52_11845 [Synechococcus sp. KORDI-52]